jgi:hypothetical protein
MKQIAVKLNKIMAGVGYIQKRNENKFQKYNYASEADFIEALRPLLVENGIVALPSVVEHSTVPAGETKSGTAQFLTTILLETVFVDTESGESITVRSIGQGMDSGDKGPYKATTGANKYCLFKLFQIATGDDPETESPEVAKPKKSKAELIQGINKALEILDDQQIAGFENRETLLEHMYQFTGVQDTTLLFKATEEQLDAYLTELRRLYKEAKVA